MLEIISFVIDTSKYPNGFYVVVIEADGQCGDDEKSVTSLVDRSVQWFTNAVGIKTLLDTEKIPDDKLLITISVNSQLRDYLVGPGIICLGYLLVFLLSPFIIWCFTRKEVKDLLKDMNSNDYMSVERKFHKRRLNVKSVVQLTTCNHEEDPFGKTDIYKRNQLHWVILILTGLFYYLPTIQMVMESSKLYSSTGNQDFCYYNFLCQRPLGSIQDFNHIFSNLGYCVLGLIFIYVVNRKETYEKPLDKMRGVPRQYSLFYALGLSLIGVGIMSACYHICPTSVTFQFDTTYMYMIAFFMFLKLYQNRHPDLVCTAFKGFLFIGGCMCLEV